jgi:hypothetical protein
MLAVRKLAWAAAIVESQGKIRLSKNLQRSTDALIMQMQSSRIPLVERLAAMTGSKVQYSAPKTIELDRRACVDHCTDPHVHVVAEIPAMALWAITGAGAAVVLDNLMPHFVSSTGLQLMVDNVIEGLPQPGMQGWHAIEQVLVRLRKLGWRIPDPLWPERAKPEQEAA